MSIALMPVHDRAALERSMPLDPLRILQEERGSALLDKIERLLVDRISRQRASSPADRDRWRATLSMLLANLVLAASNRVDPKRFVAISFNGNDYAGTGHSIIMLARMRDAFAELGFVEGQRGYRRTGNGQVLHARRTRLRATPVLRTLFTDSGVGRRDVGWHERRDCIILRQARPGAGPEPADVTASRAVLARENARLRDVRIVLPDDAWARVTARYLVYEDDPSERLVAGEESTQLYRIFKGDWDNGGRLYGGWWINLPKVERLLLTLDGETVVERDFGRLHPTLLFARTGRRLEHDIYTVEGFAGPHVRELGKRTFNRLINRTSLTSKRLSASPLDRAQLPPGTRFPAFVDALAASLAPIERWFGTGEGLRLQREDSDLALAVLDRLLDDDVLALPVHDSFIVARSNEARLIGAMRQAFEERYGFEPQIR